MLLSRNFSFCCIFTAHNPQFFRHSKRERNDAVMVKFVKFSTVLLCCLFLCACQKTPSAPRLVTQVTVTDGNGQSRDFTDPRKVETILYYLRSLAPLGKPKTDPERIMGENYRIDVAYSDGSKSIYRQRANRFLSRDSHPWQTVDSRKASILRPLLEGMTQG